jgi:hypothetical protein
MCVFRDGAVVTKNTQKATKMLAGSRPAGSHAKDAGVF